MRSVPLFKPDAKLPRGARYQCLVRSWFAIGSDQIAFKIRVGDNLYIRTLGKHRCAGNMIAMGMRVDDGFDRLVGDLAEFGENVLRSLRALGSVDNYETVVPTISPTFEAAKPTAR